MILIDSLYINNSGGLRLLQYLVDILLKKNIEFFILADSRCYGLFDRCKHVRYMKASLWERKKFYQIKKNKFHLVLCFGNIPTPIKVDVPVYTYFHNINLLTLKESRNIKEKILMWLKRMVFRLYKANTDFWLVQTSNTASELCLHLKEPEKKIILMPFYELSPRLIHLKEEKHGDNYVYVSNYTGAKGHEELLEAWKILHMCGIDRKLYLTVPLSATDFCMKIEAAKREGVHVVNHGLIPFEKIVNLYKDSKAIVYPSHNESLGLGIVEAVSAGCDVIGSDLPFLHSICKPSEVFNPYSADSIANAIMKYETGRGIKSELTIYNHIDELIELLTTDIM